MALANSREYALNAICPYFTMFPLEYPDKILRNYKKHNPLVLDPFCGRGTTLYAARHHKLSAWGIDTSPIAVAVAKAKLASCTYEAPINLAQSLLNTVTPKLIPSTPFFQAIYHPEVLIKLCALREGLLNLDAETDASVILRAAILGCLHGPLSKSVDTAGYFSNQMPRTYASKPDYAVKFWKERNLIAPKIDVLNVLRRKIDRLSGLSDAIDNNFSQVLNGDSQLESVFNQIPGKPTVVITSPPYYGMQTYVQDQWLRNWFLGGPDHVDYQSGPQLNHCGQENFIKSLGSVWKNISNKATGDLHMHVRFGIIPSATVDAKDLFKQSLQKSGVNWRLVSVRKAETASAGKRQANQMKAKSDAAVEYDFHTERI